MGVPQVTCSVCKQTVNKAQTLFIGDGQRACRSHEGVETQAKQEQAALDYKHAAGRKRPEPIKRKEQPLPELKPHCWCCGEPGIRAQEWYMELLILGEQYRITYGRDLNPLDPEETLKAYSSLRGKLCLYTVPYNKATKRVWFKGRSAKQAAELAGLFMICPQCAKKNKVDPQPHLKDIKYDDLVAHSAVYEVLVRPAIQEIAKAGLEQRN